MIKNKFIHYALVLGVIAGLSGGILATVNKATQKVIEQQKKEKETKARIMVLPKAKSFDETKIVKAKGLNYIPGKDENGNIVGYIVTVTEPGYAGNIVFMLGIGNDGKVTGMTVNEQKETPGLGSKIDDIEWQKKAIGKDVNYKFNKATDAFAGATISPRAVYTGIKRALEVFNSEVKR